MFKINNCNIYLHTKVLSKVYKDNEWDLCPAYILYTYVYICIGFLFCFFNFRKPIYCFAMILLSAWFLWDMFQLQPFCLRSYADWKNKIWRSEKHSCNEKLHKNNETNHPGIIFLFSSAHLYLRTDFVSSFLCHSHSALCNVYPVTLDRTKR